MTTLKSILLAALLTSTAGAILNAQQTGTTISSKRPEPALKVGDKAPPIVAAKWFKGTPVTKYVPGQVYVVEFWATWCGPCRAAMPHLSELARHYKGQVTFIGMDVMELIAGKDKNGDYITKVANFVKNLGDGMDYAVAADTREGVTYESWMKAAGLGGIPTSFVIDQQGKIVWIGHPMGLDDVVKLVVEGNFDDKAKEKARIAASERSKQNKVLQEQLEAMKKTGDAAKAIELADQLIERSVMNKSTFIIAKYDLLYKENPQNARKYSANITMDYASDPITLQSVATHIVKSENQADRETAVKMMEKAVSRSAPDDPYAYGNLAKIYFVSGHLKKAVSTQERVVAILADTSLVTQKEEVINEASELLKKYKAALNDKPDTARSFTNP